MAELKRSVRPTIALFSGTCDFLLGAGPEPLFVTAPLLAVVEAKNGNMREGMGPCAAEMVAARILNERAGDTGTIVYGAVTTGTSWKFMSLSNSMLRIDLDEYLIAEPARILGILASRVDRPDGSPHAAA